MPLRPAVTLALAILPLAVGAEEGVDLEMLTKIRAEGFHHSAVMETVAQLTDVIGPRLTNSPLARRANEWTRQQLEAWGLVRAHLESWGPFGRGWSLEHCSVHMVAPNTAPLIALPKAWTPGTEGVVRGKALRVKLESEADFEQYRGRLAGRILWLDNARELKGEEKVDGRYSEKDLEELSQYQVPKDRAAERAAILKRRRFQRSLNRFLAEERALATVEPSARDGGTLRVMGGGARRKEDPPGVPALVMAAAHYNRVARLLDRKIEVELELDVRTTFHDDDPLGYNTIAEIPGTDKRGEVVMLGAHLDSWHGGTGATDNAVGVGVAMEAVRILRVLEVNPKRTIRVALWTGEEQGLLGSREYVSQHFASRPEPNDPEQRELPSALRSDTGPLTIKPEHARLSAYFNLDNGTGKIRGLYLQENAAVFPIFAAWLKPLNDLGATTLTLRNTESTDHVPFDAVGLPAFQFIQDDIEYRAGSGPQFFGTHHTNMDVFDRARGEDLMQASVVMASIVYHAAMRPEMIPRKPLPRPSAPPGGAAGSP
ncbi:MAG TPA: M28 family peptidase [Vicinamibacteria bacterium]|nr:M28 family peptidase [Vicinamibacteria bacterium]